MARRRHQLDKVSGAPTDGAECGRPVKKRAYHNKLRTGCKTCKVRRIRCDEGKPACNRCESTGRRCDGYATSNSYPLPTSAVVQSLQHTTHPDVAADLALVRSRKCADELRSYRFFMEVTAPSVAGALQTDFWLLEIPRVCHSDLALWHAVVSLGSVHEAYVSGRPTGPCLNSFALKHFNLAIGALMEAGSGTEWWRALTASTIFTCICVLDGQLEQARLHFKCGCNLLRALEAAVAPSVIDGVQSESAVIRAAPQLSKAPVSVSSIRSMLISFEMVESKLDKRRISEPPSLLSNDDNYGIWRTYSAPQEGLVCGGFLSNQSISKAVRAAESLFMTLIIDSLAQAKETRKLYAEKGFAMFQSDGPRQDDHQRVFLEIEKAIKLFRDELEITPRMRPAEVLELRKALLSLCVIQATNRMYLTYDPHEPDPQRRLEGLPVLCATIVDLSEEVIGLETTVGCLRNGGPMSTPTIMNPLLAVAKSGVGRATRERAIQMLWLPRMEGVWDSRMAACMGERILDLETKVTKAYQQWRDLDGFVIGNPTARGWVARDDGEEDIHPLARVCNASMAFVARRKVRLTLRTWKQWLEGDPGEESIISW